MYRNYDILQKMVNQNYNWQMTFNIFNKQTYILLIIVLITVISHVALAQEYSFSEIRENFFRERPQTEDLVIRKNSFGSFDDLILKNFPPLHPDTKAFYTSMLTKAIMEIQHENVTDGATIWQLYNHGFVIKTPSKCFGFDLHDYFDIPAFIDLAELIDVYFISHQHTDHYEDRLINAVKALNKPVVGTEYMTRPTINMNAGDSTVISDLIVIAHDGEHSIAVRQYEVRTSEGLRFLHTGDNETYYTLPLVDNVDILLVKASISAVSDGEPSRIEGIRESIKKIKPKVTLPGHILELGHLGGVFKPMTYRDVFKADNGKLVSEYYVLGWGERYHYDNSSNDSIRPYPVQNLNATVQNTSILLSWEAPKISEDGDTATFYRIIQDEIEDTLITQTQYECEIDTTRANNFKVYSYDDCGNQSQECADFQFIPPTEVGYSFITYTKVFKLYKNYPNPFNPSTQIEYVLRKSEHVTITIYNTLGQEIETLVNTPMPIGHHQVAFNGQNLPSGVYFYRLEAGEYVQTRKMLLVK
jgi:hypothetical protein